MLGLTQVHGLRHTHLFIRILSLYLLIQIQTSSPTKKPKEAEPIFRGAFENAFLGVTDWPVEAKSPELEPETELKMEVSQGPRWEMLYKCGLSIVGKCCILVGNLP